jgi:hypothetical protein
MANYANNLLLLLGISFQHFCTAWCSDNVASMHKRCRRKGLVITTVRAALLGGTYMLAGCHTRPGDEGSVRVNAAQVIGFYAANFTNGSERLELKMDGTYLQDFSSKSRPFHHEGHWHIETEFLDGSKVVLADAAVTEEDEVRPLMFGELDLYAHNRSGRVALARNEVADWYYERADQGHIRQVILSLPTESEMRSFLERGDRGDGVHYPWMDQMKELGVKRARVFLDFTWSAWRRHPVDIGFRRIALYKSYDGNCDQITDPEQLRLIENAGLRRELERFAATATAKSHWFYIDNRPLANHGLATVELFDDGWLPRFSPNLMPLGGGEKQPTILIDGDTVHLQEALKNKKFSQDDLDGALFEVSVYLDDPCSIKLLLSAGANPNSRNTDGETPLMLAAYVGHFHGVEALLRGGADANTRNVAGETAADVALKRGHQAIASALKRNSH